MCMLLVLGSHGYAGEVVQSLNRKVKSFDINLALYEIPIIFVTQNVGATFVGRRPEV